MARCECGRAATYKREGYGCGPLPCSCCGEKVDGETRMTVIGPVPGPGDFAVLGAHVVCSSCANHCRECRPFRDSGAVRSRTGKPECWYTGRYDGVRHLRVVS